MSSVCVTSVSMISAKVGGNLVHAENERERAFKAPARSHSSWLSQSIYPSLTNLASQTLFPMDIPSPALYSQTTREGSFKLAPATYGKGKEDDDDESSEDMASSDSDSNKKTSHIPEGRLAGTAVQKKKKSSLLSGYS